MGNCIPHMCYLSKDERFERIFKHLREVPVAEAEASPEPQVIYGLAGNPTDGGHLVIAPLTGRACVYCHVAVDEWEYHAPMESDHYFITSERGHWTERFVEVQTCDEFYLTDVMVKDRQIVINTKGIDIEASIFQEISFSFGDVSQSRHYQHRFHHEELPEGIQALFARHNFSIYVNGGKAKKHLRVRESVFHVGSVLVAAGVLSEYRTKNIPENSQQPETKIESLGNPAGVTKSSDKDVVDDDSDKPDGVASIGDVTLQVPADTSIKSGEAVSNSNNNDARSTSSKVNMADGSGAASVVDGLKVSIATANGDTSAAEKCLILKPIASSMITPQYMKENEWPKLDIRAWNATFHAPKCVFTNQPAILHSFGSNNANIKPHSLKALLATHHRLDASHRAIHDIDDDDAYGSSNAGGGSSSKSSGFYDSRNNGDDISPYNDNDGGASSPSDINGGVSVSIPHVAFNHGDRTLRRAESMEERYF